MKTVKSIILVMASTAMVILPGVRADAALIFGSDINVDELITIDSSTISTQSIGSLGTSGADITGLAYDTINSILYGVSPTTDSLYTIDQQTGSATLVAAVSTGGNPNGLAFDPFAGVLYLTDNNSNGLFRYSVATAQLDSLGTITGGFSSVEGLAFDSATSTLYGLADAQDQIVRINTTSAQATGLPNSLSSGIWRGLGFDSDSEMLLATRVNDGAPLTQIDPTTGLGTDIGTIGDTGEFEFVQGLATIVPEPSSMLLATIGVMSTLVVRRRKQ